MRLSAPKKGSFAISLVAGLSAILYHCMLASPGDLSPEFLLLAFAFILLLFATMLKGL